MTKRSLILSLLFVLIAGVFTSAAVIAQETLSSEEIEENIRRFVQLSDEELEFNRVAITAPCQAYYGATKDKQVDGLVIAPGQEFRIDRLRARREFADGDRTTVVSVTALWARIDTNRRETGARPYWVYVPDCAFIKDVRG
jgi:hypothetical protein